MATTYNSLYENKATNHRCNKPINILENYTFLLSPSGNNTATTQPVSVTKLNQKQVERKRLTAQCLEVDKINRKLQLWLHERVNNSRNAVRLSRCSTRADAQFGPSLVDLHLTSFSCTFCAVRHPNARVCVLDRFGCHLQQQIIPATGIIKL